MYNNPLARVIRNAFIKNVSSQPVDYSNTGLGNNTLSNIMRNKRITTFEQAINRFLTASGLSPVKGLSQFADEKNLLTFSLQLSGYIRDAQKELTNLKKEQAYDNDLINLYKAAAKYSADCSGQIKDSKYIFKEHCDYCFYKVKIFDSLSNAKFNNHGFVINPKRRNLILSMPFHIKPTQEELQLWTTKYFNKLLDNKDVFGSDVDIYLAHFPIEQPRGEKFALSLQTIRNPESYFTETDMRFVTKYLTPLLGKEIKVDANNHIISGTPHDNETFKQNCMFTIGSYCAGGTHSHRWINAFAHLAEQLYDKQTNKQALQNIFTVNYALMPLENYGKTSGAYFLSNYANDDMRKEPFIKMFAPEAYEEHKYLPSSQSYRITAMPDGYNHIISFRLPEDFAITGADGQIQQLKDLENGHHMGCITQPNANSHCNQPYQIFQTVLQNAVQGKRGAEVLNFRQQTVKHAHLPFAPIKHPLFTIPSKQRLVGNSK